jgi:hypothetical protein
MNLEIGTILNVTQIIIAALIAVVPPFYPRFSLFMGRVTNALNQIVENQDVNSEFDVSAIERGDSGFDALAEVIEHNYPIASRPSKIGLVLADSSSDLEDFVNVSIGAATLTNVIFYVEYEDGSREDVIFHPFDPNKTNNLGEIKNWARNRATQRANYITTTLVILWTAVSIYTVV